MQTETTQTAAVVSLPLLLGLGWAVAIGVLAYGLLKRQSGMSRLGFALTGLMILVTPLAWYAYETGRPDLYTIGLLEVLILGLVAFAGGVVAVLGFLLPEDRFSQPAKR